MSKILVTGGAGSVGSELVRQLHPEHEVEIIDINETAMFDLVEELGIKGRVGDIRDSEVLQGKYDIIYHCGALKHVTPNEQEPIEAVKTNILGTYNVIEFAKKTGTKLINISTDKVVNGESIMGLTKKIAEKMVKNAGFVSVRFGNVMGSRGSVIPIWQKQMDEGKPLTITDKRMERYMMTIPQAVELVIEASKMPQDGRIVILDMGEPINILDLAMGILDRSGAAVGVKEIGIRPGETLSEKLMTEEEKQKAVKEGDFWII